MDAFDIFTHRPVNRLAVAHVGEIDHDAADVVHVAARLFHEHLDVRHGLGGLRRGVADVEGLARVEILGNLAAQEHRAPTRDHALAEVVVELLLGIGVPCVEFAVTIMRHSGLRSSLRI